ncbi:MAG: BatD family protein, partial [Deltaproteobacteria bacterium]|nr:BatD family protein [Deltaproteobacteria bacterium]
MGPGPAKTGKTGKNIFRLAAALIILLASQWVSPAEAAISVTLRLDRQKTAPGTSVLLTVSLSGVRRVDTGPAIRGLEEFRVSSGDTSSFTEFRNGQASYRLEYKYYLRPGKIGTFRIGPAEINIGGQVYQSNAVTLSVEESSPARGADRGSLFLESSISKTKAYVEEQIIYTLKLYVRTRISDISLELPEMDHLAFKQLARPRNYRGTYNGRACQVLEVHYSLIPSKEGAFGLPPARMRLTVYESRSGSNRGSDSFFNSPFFSTGKPKTVSGKPYELEVIPLPEAGRPTDFTGLVGEF